MFCFGGFDVWFMLNSLSNSLFKLVLTLSVLIPVLPITSLPIQNLLGFLDSCSDTTGNLIVKLDFYILLLYYDIFLCVFCTK